MSTPFPSSSSSMVSLAGACYFALHEQTPTWRRTVAECQGLDWKPPQHHEHAEADDAMAYHDITAAIEYIGMLSMLAHEYEAEYDALYEEKMACLVGRLGEEDTTEIGCCTVKPITGFKQPYEDGEQGQQQRPEPE